MNAKTRAVMVASGATLDRGEYLLPADIGASADAKDVLPQRACGWSAGREVGLGGAGPGLFITGRRSRPSTP
jgi:hypothetical protein